MKSKNMVADLAAAAQKRAIAKESAETMSGADGTTGIPPEDIGELLAEPSDSQVTSIQEEVLADDIDTINACDHVLADVKPEDAKAVEFAEERINAIANRYGIVLSTVSKESHFGVPARNQTHTDLLREQAHHINNQLFMAQEGLMQRARIALKHAFTFRTSYIKQLDAVIARAQAAEGTVPKQGVVYQKESYIAKFTNGEGKVVEPKQLGQVIDDCAKATGGFRFIMDEIEKILTGFSEGKLSSNFDMKNFTKTLTPSRQGMAVGGGIGMGGILPVVTMPNQQVDNVGSFFFALKKSQFAQYRLWSEGDLHVKELPAISPREILAGCQAMRQAATKIANIYDEFDETFTHMLGEATRDQNSANGGLIAIIIKMFRDAKTVVPGMSAGQARAALYHFGYGMARQVETVYDCNFKALQCMLNYYNWSLSNQE